MSDSPYTAPQSTIETPPDDSLQVPEAITKKIKGGWLAALVTGTLTLGLTVLAMNSDSINGIFSAWTFIDVVLIFGLAIGIKKKSRIASTLMFTYFLASKILIMIETGSGNGIVMAMLFLYFYFQAMIGTFQYHKFKKQALPLP